MKKWNLRSICSGENTTYNSYKNLIQKFIRPNEYYYFGEFLSSIKKLSNVILVNAVFSEIVNDEYL